jgi:TIR domain
MNPSGQESARGSDPPTGHGGSGTAADHLARAAAALQVGLGKDLWGRLDVRTKSCLVTSQLFHELLQEVWTDREKELERTGKRTGEMEAPLVDFSPVVLCLFKALEIEIERKILRPFREALPPALRERLSETDWATQELASLARFVRYGKPTPNLKAAAVLFPALRGCQANRTSLLGLLKRWMKTHLQRANRWWRDDKLSRRLQQAIDTHRNAAAHTGRLTPLEAQKALAELWGKAAHDGLVPTTLRAIEEVPVPKAEAAAERAGGPFLRGELRKDLTVHRVLLLKPRYWLVEAVDEEVGDHYAVVLVPGDFEAVKLDSGEFKARRQILDEHLLPLVKWFGTEAHWGQRIAVAWHMAGPCELPVRKKSSAGVLEADASLALALSLARGTAALHEGGFTHGFISPHTVFRRGAGDWSLGGQSLILLARRGCAVYLYPRVVAPEVDRRDARTLTPAADVCAIAATVCCLRAGPGLRNAGPVTPASAEGLFPPGLLRENLCRALSPDPRSRHADASELRDALTGWAPVRPSAGRPCPVMISYSRADAQQADQLIAELGAQGVRAWRDREMIPGGARWMQEIVSAVQSCRVVILLVSEKSLSSEHVPREVYLAFHSQKVILPVFLERVELRGEFSYMLGGVQRLALYQTDRAEALRQLMRALAESGVLPERPGR